MELSMSKTDLAILAAQGIVAAGTSKIVKAIITNNVNPETKLEKIEIIAASIIVGMMAKDATKRYTSQKIHWHIEKFKEIKAKVNSPEDTTEK